MAKGNKPDTPEYKRTVKNTKAYSHGNDHQDGASGDSEKRGTERQDVAGAPPFQGRRRSDKQESMDLGKNQFPKDSRYTNCYPNLHKKKSKVLPSRQHFSGSAQQPDVSSATFPLQDTERDGDIDCTSKVFSYGADEANDVETDTPENAEVYSNFEPFNRQDEENQLIGAGHAAECLIAEETQAPQNQGRSDELVCEKKDTFCVANILPSSKNYEDFPSICLRELVAVKHKERLNPAAECGNCENGFHATEMHDFHSHHARGGQVLEYCKQRVGLVRCETCGDRGTCFRVGKCDIATCWHVISQCTDHHITVIFYHQGPNQRDTWEYTMTKKMRDTHLDFAILELCSNGKNFPPAFTKFRDSTHADGSSERLVHLACFQKLSTDQSRLDVHCDTVRLNRNTFDEDRLYKLNLMVMEKHPKNISRNLPYEDLHKDNEHHVPLLCKVIHGGSGGVGVFIGNGEVVVDFMYRRGYPGFFYETDTGTALTTDEKAKFPSCHRMEVGLDIQMMEKASQGLWDYGK